VPGAGIGIKAIDGHTCPGLERVKVPVLYSAGLKLFGAGSGGHPGRPSCARGELKVGLSALAQDGAWRGRPPSFHWPTANRPH